MGPWRVPELKGSSNKDTTRYAWFRRTEPSAPILRLPIQKRVLVLPQPPRSPPATQASYPLVNRYGHSDHCTHRLRTDQFVLESVGRIRGAW